MVCCKGIFSVFRPRTDSAFVRSRLSDAHLVDPMPMKCLLVSSITSYR